MPPKGDFGAVRPRMQAVCADEDLVGAAVLRLLRATAGRQVDPEQLRRACAKALAEELRSRGQAADEARLYDGLGELPAAPDRGLVGRRRRPWRGPLAVVALGVTVALLVTPWMLRNPAGPRSDVLYFAMVDRFADGLPDPPGTVDRSDPQAWHGGDLPGLLGKVDHLERLGVDALWLSPVSLSRHEPIGGWGAYHGYWVFDPGAVDPRFGTADDLRALSDALHDRGMRLYLDVVYNHVGYDAPLVREHPDWFHREGDVTDWDDPEQLVTHDVHGLPDLAQEDERVYAWLRDRSLALVEAARPDGFRVDAVRHLPEGFLARLGPELKAAARPGFELLGEVFDGNPDRLAARARADRLDAVFDFPLHYALVDTYCRDAPVGRVAASLVPDYGGARPVTLLDNHDTPRIRSACDGDAGRVAQALAFLLTARGTPSITWGTEVGLEGAEEPANRADMVFREPDPVLRDLLALRAEEPALRDGDTRVLSLSDQVLVVARTVPDRTVIVTVNRSAEPVRSPAWPVLGHASPRTRTVPETPEDTVPPRSTRIDRYDRGVAPRTAEVALRIVPEPLPPLTEGETLVLVGPGALGAWDPPKGVRLGPDGAFALTVSDGSVLAFKLVRGRADGTFTWEDRPDRFLLVTSDRVRDGCGTACAAVSEGRASYALTPHPSLH